MKEFWFFFPLKYILKYFGGIPVPPKKSGGNLTQKVAKLFKTEDYVNLAVTPEGTRANNQNWRTGFLYISYEAKVPIQLGIIDYNAKEIIIHDEFKPSGDINQDMEYVKQFYSPYVGTRVAKYPEKFSV